MNNFIKEFKEFALKGNVIEVAIGLVMGAAFKEVVTAFTDAIISPILGILFNQNLSYLSLTIGNVVFTYGNLISTVINFGLTAFVLFLFVKIVNKTKQEKETQEIVSDEIALLREIRDSLKK
ncbi:MAG: large conductance mechanosensitive channel protein MscL [Anaerorhabdus sp.]